MKKIVVVLGIALTLWGGFSAIGKVMDLKHNSSTTARSEMLR